MSNLLTLNNSPIILQKEGQSSVPATLTITSTDYTGQKGISLAYLSQNKTIFVKNSSLGLTTIPFTIETYINCGIYLGLYGWDGIP